MKITDQIHALMIPFQIRDPSGLLIPRFVYSYLVYGREITLIDSGVASSEQIIFDYLRDTDREPQEISRLILTHAHPDHIGSAKAIKEISGCRVACHPEDRAWIEDPDRQFSERPVPGFHSLVSGPVGVDETLQEGDAIDLEEGLRLEVLHTPGHSPGSISLWTAEQGALFSADAIPLAGEMPIYDDILSTVESIKRLKAIEGIRVLLSAWDEPRAGKDAYRIMDQGLDYLQRIHSAAIKAAAGKASWASMDICRQIVLELGLPEMTANPLTCRSFQSSLRYLTQEDLLRNQK